MGIQEYGINFYTQTYQYQGRGQSDPSEIEDIRVKNFGIIAASAAHQDKSQGYEGQADEHKHIIPLLKYEFGAWLIARFLLFTHAANLII